MDVVKHNGIEYKKVAVLAKEFNYTTDYIGQLCRGEKVDARLVGRAWYVNPESLRKHKKSRYQESFKERLEEKEEPEKPEKNYLERVKVESVRTNKTVKIHKHLKGQYQEVSVQYEADDESLIPRVIKDPVYKEVPIDLAEATPVDIKSAPKQSVVTKLKPEPIPTVYMKGKLPVTDVAEKASIPVAEATPHANTAKSIQLHIPGKKPVQPERNRQVEMSPITSNKPTKYSHLGSKAFRTPPSERAPDSFHPRSVSYSSTPKPGAAAKKTVQYRQTASTKQSSTSASAPKTTNWGVFVIATILALGIAALVLFLETDVTVYETGAVTNFNLDFSVLMDRF